MGLFSRNRETAEEAYQRDTVQPRQEADATRTARIVATSTKTTWRDRATPAEQARIGYDAGHPKHPRNRRYFDDE
jgi:hypothetical protein